MSDLLTVTSIAEDPGAYVRRHGTVLAEFGHLSQDSGNVSWLVESTGQRLFVKTAGPSGPPPAGKPRSYLNHEARVRLLRNAIDLASSCRHSALPRLLNVIESPAGPALIYEAVAGELVGGPGGNAKTPPPPISGSHTFPRIGCSRSSTCCWIFTSPLRRSAGWHPTSTTGV